MDNSKIISVLLEQQNKLHFTMLVDKIEHEVNSFSMAKSQTHVTKPTLRGGVYFSNIAEFNIKANLSNTNLSSTLSKTMLGPNADFTPILFLTYIELDSAVKQLKILTNLINYVQRGNGLELNLTVIGIDLI